MTNGDRVREMASTNEGLAHLMAIYVRCGRSCPIDKYCKGEEPCEEITLKWLNEEILKPCPFCGDEDIREYNECNHVWLECPECGGRTKMCRTLYEAKTLWNRRAGNAD